MVTRRSRALGWYKLALSSDISTRPSPPASFQVAAGPSAFAESTAGPSAFAKSTAGPSEFAKSEKEGEPENFWTRESGMMQLESFRDARGPVLLFSIPAWVVGS